MVQTGHSYKYNCAEKMSEYRQTHTHNVK